jgi:hypothetical protein
VNKPTRAPRPGSRPHQIHATQEPTEFVDIWVYRCSDCGAEGVDETPTLPCPGVPDEETP